MFVYDLVFSRIENCIVIGCLSGVGEFDELVVCYFCHFDFPSRWLSSTQKDVLGIVVGYINVSVLFFGVLTTVNVTFIVRFLKPIHFQRKMANCLSLECRVSFSDTTFTRRTNRLYTS